MSKDEGEEGGRKSVHLRLSVVQRKAIARNLTSETDGETLGRACD